MGNKTLTEESGWANSLSSIDNLIRQDEVAGRDLLTKRTDGGESKDGLNTEMLQSSNVGTAGNFGGGEVVTAAMTSQESNLASGWRASNDNFVTGKSPGLLCRVGYQEQHTFNKPFKSYTYSLGVYFLDNFEIVEIVETGSANDGNGDILGVDHVSKRERGVDSATCFQNASVLCQFKKKKKKLGLR
jgi:hypothetical protein